MPSPVSVVWVSVPVSPVGALVLLTLTTSPQPSSPRIVYVVPVSVCANDVATVTVVLVFETMVYVWPPTSIVMPRRSWT